MRHIRDIRRLLRNLERTLTYNPETGATCPVCGTRLRTTSTAYRDSTVVKRRHKCLVCDWTFSSVEDLVDPEAEPAKPAPLLEAPGRKGTTRVPSRPKTCEDKRGNRKGG